MPSTTNCNLGVMKTITFSLMFAAALLVGCSSGQDSYSQAEQTGPVQWVTYEGHDGPGEGKHIVLVSGDEEYRSEEALPQLAKILSHHHGFKSTVLFAQNPEKLGVIDPNYMDNIPGLDALDNADLMVLFTRFRALPDNQMQHFEDYLKAGRPVFAIRTATHAFQFRDSTSKWLHWSNSHNVDGHPWDGGFGRLVLGERWHTHHGHHKHQSTKGIVAPGAGDHPIANGLDNAEIWGPTDVYGVRLPMPEGVTPIVLGQVINRPGEFDENDLHFGMRPTDSEVATVNPASRTEYNPNDPLMPIAWTKPYQLPEGAAGMAFTSTIGSSSDMVSDGVRQLMVNAVYHLLDMDVPADANVDIVGEFNPSPYSFQSDEYWAEKDMKVSDYLSHEGDH